MKAPPTRAPTGLFLFPGRAMVTTRPAAGSAPRSSGPAGHPRRVPARDGAGGRPCRACTIMRRARHIFAHRPWLTIGPSGPVPHHPFAGSALAVPPAPRHVPQAGGAAPGRCLLMRLVETRHDPVTAMYVSARRHMHGGRAGRIRPWSPPYKFPAAASFRAVVRRFRSWSVR
jgi:hypothetical protein